MRVQICAASFSSFQTLYAACPYGLAALWQILRFNVFPPSRKRTP